MIHGNVENSILDEVIPPSVCDVLDSINCNVKLKLNDTFDNLRYRILSSTKVGERPEEEFRQGFPWAPTYSPGA